MEQQYIVDGPNLIIASVLVLALGSFLNRKIPVLARFNIPVAVTGGLLFSVMFTVLYKAAGIRVDFDLELRNLLLLTFFSTIGLSAKLSTLAAGGRTLVILLAFAILLLICQDLAGIGIALAVDAHPAHGLFAGSISFAGGHGTSIAWGETAEKAGLVGAGTLGIACATFGLVSGGLVGGPIGGFLIKKFNLGAEKGDAHQYEVAEESSQASVESLPLEARFATLLLLALCVALGHNLNEWLAARDVALPQFLTAMFIGITLADLAKLDLHKPSINRAGEVSLHLFLAMSLMSVQLWLLADAIGILLIVLAVQMLVISVLAVFLVFRFTGQDYDAAVIASPRNRKWGLTPLIHQYDNRAEGMREIV